MNGRITVYFIKNPRALLLTDSLGAMLTAGLLWVVVRRFNEFFGLLVVIISFLFLIALCFCVYSSFCYFLVKKDYALYLRIIGIANLLYCVLTLGVLLFYSSQVTLAGWVYFLAEIAVVCRLVFIELQVAGAPDNKLTALVNKVEP